MSTSPTPPVVVVGTGTPAQPSKLSLILAIIQAALAGLTAVPVIGPEAALANAFLAILRNGLAAYQAETGQPLDLTKIPLETPVA